MRATSPAHFKFLVAIKQAYSINKQNRPRRIILKPPTFVMQKLTDFEFVFKNP